MDSHASKPSLALLIEMETTETRAKHSKDQEHFPMENGEAQSASLETRVIRLGPTSFTPTASGDGGEGESDVKTFQTEHRGKKRTPIAVQRDDDDDYR